jgi:hypothetical protein
LSAAAETGRRAELDIRHRDAKELAAPAHWSLSVMTKLATKAWKKRFLKTCLNGSADEVDQRVRGEIAERHLLDAQFEAECLAPIVGERDELRPRDAHQHREDRRAVFVLSQANYYEIWSRRAQFARPSSTFVEFSHYLKLDASPGERLDEIA